MASRTTPAFGSHPRWQSTASKERTRKRKRASSEEDETAVEEIIVISDEPDRKPHLDPNAWELLISHPGLSDVTVELGIEQADGTVIRVKSLLCSRLLLASRSEFFRAMFLGSFDLKRNEQGVLVVPLILGDEKELEAACILIKGIISDDLEVPRERDSCHPPSLWRVASRLMVGKWIFDGVAMAVRRILRPRIEAGCFHAWEDLIDLATFDTVCPKLKNWAFSKWTEWMLKILRGRVSKVQSDLLKRTACRFGPLFASVPSGLQIYVPELLSHLSYAGIEEDCDPCLKRFIEEDLSKLSKGGSLSLHLLNNLPLMFPTSFDKLTDRFWDARIEARERYKHRTRTRIALRGIPPEGFLFGLAGYLWKVCFGEVDHLLTVRMVLPREGPLRLKVPARISLFKGFRRNGEPCVPHGKDLLVRSFAYTHAGDTAVLDATSLTGDPNFYGKNPPASLQIALVIDRLFDSETFSYFATQPSAQEDETSENCL